MDKLPIPHEVAFEFLRHRAGIDLTPHQQTELQRLIKTLRYGSRFQFIFVEIADQSLRARLITLLEEALVTTDNTSICIDMAATTLSDVPELKALLTAENVNGATIIHLLNADAWLDDKRLSSLNLRREALAHGLTCRLVFWLSGAALERVAQQAADLWSWRSGVYTMRDWPA